MKALSRRVTNKYTVMGLTVLVSQLESIGIIPKGSLQILPGMTLESIVFPIIFAIGFYLIFHIPIPKIKNTLQIKQEELDILKLDINILKAQKELEQERSVAVKNTTASNTVTNNIADTNSNINN